MKSKLFSSLVVFIIIFVSSTLTSGVNDKKLMNTVYNSSITDCSTLSRSKRQYHCILAPKSTEGPYFLPDDLNRIDIREKKQGIPLRLEIFITDATDCSPISGAIVHVWQADALGHYSGFNGAKNFANRRQKPSSSERFLRGYQVTNNLGKVSFITMIPGWYPGRTMHIHVEINRGPRVVYIGQLFFPEKFAQIVSKMSPYSSSRSYRVTNDEDAVYTRSQGSSTTLSFSGDLRNNLKSVINLGIGPSRTRTR
ncbi:uncharacterized protein LOC141851346 [Brevipalpus obovatus]|uniref:uncharacterized protein LOC141851346 n=1 Tax=Brevipalpus obovatus TaxID=246614 RepID=UPI003D9F85DB